MTKHSPLRLVIEAALLQERDRLTAEGAAMKDRNPKRAALKERLEAVEDFIAILAEDRSCTMRIEREFDPTRIRL